MKYSEPTAEDYENIAAKVRSGEYFREARAMVDVLINDSMAERYFYTAVTFVALLTFVIALIAMQFIYPLSRTVPFIYSLNDVLEDVPTIAPLRSSNEQSVDEAVLFFLAGNYIKHYESYNIDTIERNLTAVQHYSSPEMFARYQVLLQISNPESPVVKYQRHSARSIKLFAPRVLISPANTVEMDYEASLENAEGVQKTRYRATITYEYSGIEFDKKTDTVKPFTFLVKDYSSKLIQDSQ